MKHLKRLKINSDYLLKYFASHFIGLLGFTQVIWPTVRVFWIRWNWFSNWCWSNLDINQSNAIIHHFRMQMIKRSDGRLRIGLQYILIVIWYTFSGFDNSNKSEVFTAAKLPKILKITPQMYQVKVVTLLSEPTKVEWSIQYVSYCVSYKSSPCIRPYFK